MKAFVKTFALFTLCSVLFGCGPSYEGELIFVEPGRKDPFKYPYFLYIPDEVPVKEKVYFIVEPNNSGFVDDDLETHIEKAKRTATNDFYLGNHVANTLKTPLLVPVFPRSKSDWKIYSHSLDRDVMLQKGNSLERIDNQLIEMFEDARIRLEEKGIPSYPQFLLTGFSASGTFANRFTLIHPDKVLAVAAGGLNGLLMLPVDSLANETLNYPIGLADFSKITSKTFQREEFLSTPQFYFMGALDANDAIPYDDAYDEPERDQIFRLLGEQMQPERWENCRDLYALHQADAKIKTYEHIGHEHPEEVKSDIVEFFKSKLEYQYQP